MTREGRTLGTETAREGRPIEHTTEQHEVRAGAADPAPASLPTAPAPAPSPAQGLQPARPPALGDSFGFRRVDRRSGRGKRTRVEVRKVGPWSVLKFSLLFYFCLMLIIWVALVIIYLVLSAAGAIDALARILGEIFANGPTSTRGATPIPIDGVKVFTYLFLAGCVFTVIWSLVNVFVAFIYNLISDVVGGIEVTLGDPQR
jgi:transmembrane protein DUF3566